MFPVKLNISFKPTAQLQIICNNTIKESHPDNLSAQDILFFLFFFLVKQISVLLCMYA